MPFFLAPTPPKIFLSLFPSANSWLTHLYFQKSLGLNVFSASLILVQHSSPPLEATQGSHTRTEWGKEAGAHHKLNWEFFGATASGEWFCLLPRRKRLTCLLCSKGKGNVSSTRQETCWCWTPPFTSPHSQHFETQDGSQNTVSCAKYPFPTMSLYDKWKRPLAK